MGNNDDDYDELKDLAVSKGESRWSCLKDTEDGDLLFFYFTKPKSAIVATGIASGNKERGGADEWAYMVGIKNIEMLQPPISLEKLRICFPKWGWAKSPRYDTYVSDPMVSKLQKLARCKGQPNAGARVQMNNAGGGFGTPEQNRIVEQAACKAVQRHFRNQGYELVSREKENLGYDFDVRRKSEELHIEVKGISGSLLKFMITTNEIKCARTDSKFQLAAVTEATTVRRHIQFFTGKEFLNKFGLKPAAYFAEVKRNLSA